MNKLFKSLLTIIAFMSISYNVVGQIDTDELDYPHLLLPVYGCEDCDTLRLPSGKPVLLFTYITGRTIDIENLENPYVYREWRELQSHYQDKIDFRYMNKYGVVEVNGKEKLSLEDAWKSYIGVYYWDGKASSSFKFFENFACLTEEISTIRGEKLQSSYMKEYLEKKEWIESLAKLNNPSDALKKNMRYYDYCNRKAIEYFPHFLLDLKGIKSAKIFLADRETEIIKFSINPQQCIDTISVFDEYRKLDEQMIAYGFENQLLPKQELYSFAYNNDTIIAYYITSHRISLSLYVMKGKKFILQEYYSIDTENKVIQEENRKERNNPEKEFNVYISNAKWKLSTDSDDGDDEMKLYIDETGKQLIMEEYYENEMTGQFTCHLNERGLIDRVERYIKRRNSRITLNYEYEFYK